MSGLMDQYYREKTVAYSNCGRKFVNAFNHRGEVAKHSIERKRVDSYRIPRKPRPWLDLARWPCGKTEDGFGKKGESFFRPLSRIPLRSSRITLAVRSDWATCGRHGGRGLSGPHCRAHGKELCMASPAPLIRECRKSDRVDLKMGIVRDPLRPIELPQPFSRLQVDSRGRYIPL